MPSVANTVVVHNRTNRAYFIGGVEVPAGGWGRVDGKHPFLAELISRGSFRIQEDAPAPAPVVVVAGGGPVDEPSDSEPSDAPKPAQPKKNTNKTSSKGDDE